MNVCDVLYLVDRHCRVGGETERTGGRTSPASHLPDLVLFTSVGQNPCK